MGATPGCVKSEQFEKLLSAVYLLVVPVTGFGLAIALAGGVMGLPLPSLQKPASPVPSMK